MKRIIAFITVFTILATNLPSYAQDSASIVPAVLKRLSLSYDLNTLYPKDLDNVYFNGGAVGYNMDFRISESKPLYIGTGLDLHMVTRSKTYYQDEQYNLVNIKQRTTFINMNVPVDISLRIPLYHNLTFTPFAGLNFRIQLYGHNRNRIQAGADSSQLEGILDRMELGPADGNLFSEKDYGDAHLNRFQMGWHAGIRLQYRHISLQASYGSDFVKLHRNLGSSNLIISVGYTL